jgi:hypothetical protein
VFAQQVFAHEKRRNFQGQQAGPCRRLKWQAVLDLWPCAPLAVCIITPPRYRSGCLPVLAYRQPPGNLHSLANAVMHNYRQQQNPDCRR